MNVEKFISVYAIVILALQKLENVLYSNHLGRQTTPPVQTLFLIGNFNIGGWCVRLHIENSSLGTPNVGYMGYSLHSCPLIHLPTFPKPFSPFSLYSITVILLGCPLWITPPSCHWVEQGILAKSPSAICLFCSSITNMIHILPTSGNQLHIVTCYCSPNCQKKKNATDFHVCMMVFAKTAFFFPMTSP